MYPQLGLVFGIEHISTGKYGHATWLYIDVLVQDCSNLSALAMELLQSCCNASNWVIVKMFTVKLEITHMCPICYA